ncbi:hypothetical protein DL546_001733 [Coniochaeta pulveracea]|uniref:BZIP domain-containing protein n=1 Tax=Coniochaeta pulveracea TaxID=177199 RepID=A0A420YB05_9PEZI|nr:hypothetical protein DL546_001733 [Coniochaeta pulveracea]
MSSTPSPSFSRKRALATSKTKEDEWTDVTDPEERRRRQNRIAQRKFREKARDLKEQAQRDAQNREHACRSYHIPNAAELSLQTECSGLPWGSFNMPFIIGKGHEAASQQGSGWVMQNHSASSQQMTSPEQYLMSPFSYGQTPGTYIELTPNTGNDEAVYDESLCFYDQIDRGADNSGCNKWQRCLDHGLESCRCPSSSLGWAKT